MNIIAPVFAPGAQTSPQIEDALRVLMAGPKPKRVTVPASIPGKGAQLAETVARQERVKQMVAEGMSAPEIGDKLGVSPGSVWYDLRTLGLRPVIKGRLVDAMCQDRRDAISGMMDHPTNVLAEMFGVSPKTIRKDIREIRKSLDGWTFKTTRKG